MKTASYFTFSGPGRIGITAYPPKNPRFRPPHNFRPLAPKPDMLKLPYDDYRERYFGQILAPLDPAETVAELERLAAGAEPVLLCYERPPFVGDNWCHRRMVADWLHDTLGLDVPEL